MNDFKYHPLVDTDTAGQEKVPLFFTDDKDTVTENHKFYLMETITQYYRLCAVEPQEDTNFSIHCPHCGAVMEKIASPIDNHTLGLYTCDTCRETNI